MSTDCTHHHLPTFCFDIFKKVLIGWSAVTLHNFSHPGELGAHFLGLFDHGRLQHVLGTLGVDESVSGVQSLGLIHPLGSLFDVASMLQERKRSVENTTAAELRV